MSRKTDRFQGPEWREPVRAAEREQALSVAREVFWPFGDFWQDKSHSPRSGQRLDQLR